ncbi:uncharacterized protein Tco025E_05203 [Trypanosoma conorhini]|uniref:Uncharacterized protein n=1 Tax=Trypanosoma conorhini TaxID=83891 RepID=A0A422PFM6_9TRYP|nr:uncharacterized protein Tco025E_05203 [Trypanosoma conorhini]RNF16520.1 hypothetical protein Tco025E_05203 [Trypanosoma conorhini]
MLRRLHTRIVGMGSVCGMAPSPPAEVFLKTLPPPEEVDHAKYRRFEREERERQQPARMHFPLVAPEPFYDIRCGAAGHRHVALMTREGNLITFGDNRHGQTAAPRQDRPQRPRQHEAEAQNAHSRTLGGKSQVSDPGWAPLYIDLNGAFSSGRQSVSCGSNYTLVYQPGGRRVIAFGNNHVGQLGVGHKSQIDGEKGFAAWNPTDTWWGDGGGLIRGIVCGFNHTVLQLTCGSLLSFGSNTWGELGIGSTVSPMQPTRLRYFESKGIEIAKVAAGNSFSLFLSSEGRVYGCGATNAGQLPPNEFEPVPVPLTRSFQHGAHSGGAKLIRIKDIACVGSMAVFLSSKNELLVQGALPDYGFQISAPRFEMVNQQPALDYFRSRLPTAVAAPWGDGGFDVDRLVQGPSTLLVIYRNGCVAGLGANTEGQLQSIRKSWKGKEVNLARAFAADELFPVLVPAKAPAGEEGGGAAPWLTSGSGFTLLFDNDEVYAAGEEARPIELPPPSAAKREKRAPR